MEEVSLIDKQYLKEHYLIVYLEDAIGQLLSLRQESNKSTTLKPSKFLKEYFISVHQGTHVLFREFAFVQASPYNRLCVLKAIMQIYKPLFYKEEKYNAADYHSILQLVWPDFHMQVVHDAFTTYDDEKKDEENRLKFLDFVRAMKASFCSGEFDYEASIIDKQLDTKIEEFSKITTQCSETPMNLSETDFLVNVEDDGSEQASSWSAGNNILQASDFKRILNINDSNSVSSDEPAETSGKLSRSSSGSKDCSKSDHITGAFSRPTSTSKSRGRLSGKQLSNSLSLLQTGKSDAENKKTKRRHRSKSAVAVERSHTNS